MHRFSLSGADTFLTLAPRWADLGSSWQIALLALALLGPLILIVWLFRYEFRLVTKLQACGLLSLRLMIVFVLWFAVCFQPQIAKIHETPGRVRLAVDLSASMDVTDLDAPQSRREIVQNILSAHGKNLLQRLADRHEIELVGFHQESMDIDAAQLSERRVDGRNAATNLLLPLARPASERNSRLLGIVVLTDGQHNVGAPPLDRADELAKERVPIFPVVIGPREPPNDLMVLDVQAPTKVFKDATAPVEIRIKATSLPAQDLSVAMAIAGKPVRPEHRQVLRHKGKDEVYTVRFQAKMEEVGHHALEVKASSEGKEITLANNAASRVIRVAEDKARILIIDSEARWEYHYLTVALQRDPTIAVDRVLFSPLRIGAIKDADLEKAGLAKTKLPEWKSDSKDRDPLLEYDCIILGDVSPQEISLVDRRRIEKFVAERGGTLLMVAGKRHLPMAYAGPDEPFARMLPIQEPRELKKDSGFALALTSEGKLHSFLQLEPDRPIMEWPELPKHYWGIVGNPKPAASVLLAASLAPEAKEKSKPSEGAILAHQNHGFGRVLFLGIDSTWRWRFRVGDTYHHRFWGQLARWAAAEKLLPAGNRLVRYGPREPIYTEGQEIDLAARLSESLPPLKDKADARIKIHRHIDGKEETVAVIPLSPSSRQSNLLEARVRDLTPGVYRVELDIPQFRDEIAAPPDEKEALAMDRDLFRVLSRPQTEMLDLAANWPLLQSLADRSGGKLYTPADIDEIVERLARRVERDRQHRVQRPWQDEPMVWWMLGLLLALLTIEWSWRRWLELA